MTIGRIVIQQEVEIFPDILSKLPIRSENTVHTVYENVIVFFVELFAIFFLKC